MANLDTRNKRMSMLALALPASRLMPVADGGFTTPAERAQLLYLYAFGSAAPVVFSPWWAHSGTKHVGPVVGP